MFADDLEEVLPHLRAFARALCNNAALADDIVQDACLKAWDARASFDPAKGTFKAWMFRILRNEYYQFKRRDWRSVNKEVHELEASLVSNCGLQSASDLKRMMRAIFALKDDQRDAFILIVAAGFTYDEAGEVCGVSGGTIKSRVSRAREHVLAWYHSDEAIPTQNSAEELSSIDCPIDMIYEHVVKLRGLPNAA